MFTRMTGRTTGLLILCLGLSVRAVDVWRPADGRVREAWRECDYAAVARNFYREGMDILRPRVDWRGGGPGFVEMEFPAIPWLMAASYRVFGLHEVVGRLLAFVFSLGTLLVFWSLARRLLPGPAASAGFLFFALNPLAVRVSNSLQPEGLMLLLSLLAVLGFVRWLDEKRRIWYLASAAALAGAILVKAPAAHVGLFLLGLLISRRGPRAILRPEAWIFGVLSLGPALLWYVHAKGFWLAYGLSLGVSNESHWLGLDMFRAPLVLAGFLDRVVRLEAIFVWTPPGAVLAMASLWTLRKERAARILSLWIAALAIYYLIAIRTVADGWAAYYHVAAVPAASLAFGLGFSWLRGRFAAPRASASLASAVLVLVLGFQGFLVLRDFRPRTYAGLFSCAVEFRTLIPGTALILASGGSSRDETGRPVAYNASSLFYWLDRKGWNIPADGQSIEAVRDYAVRGASFFVAEKAALAEEPGFEKALRAVFPVLGECREALLFRIAEGPVSGDDREAVSGPRRNRGPIGRPFKNRR